MREYAFLMIDYDTPDFITKLQKQIPESELYVEEDSDDYGLEKETHVTVAPCLDNDIDLDKLKGCLDKIDKYELLLTNISLFQNEKFDVLKCDAHSVLLFNTNSKIKENFELHSEYEEYHPHVTIAYLKSGMGEKYKKDILTPLVKLKPKNFNFSYRDKEGKDHNDKFVV